MECEDKIRRPDQTARSAEINAPCLDDAHTHTHSGAKIKVGFSSKFFLEHASGKMIQVITLLTVRYFMD